MATGKALDGKPYAGHPHVRLDEGAGAPRHSGRSALLYRKLTGNAAILAAAMCVTAALPSYARTITVTGYDVGTRTATLAFEGTAAGVECLYVAYGNTDYGESIGAWPNKVRLDANLAADATSGEIRPASCRDRLLSVFHRYGDDASLRLRGGVP